MNPNTKIDGNGFFGDFWLWDTFQEQIALTSPEIDQDKLCIKFSALNVDFNDVSLELLGWRKPSMRESKRGTPIKMHYFSAVGSFRMGPVVPSGECE